MTLYLEEKYSLPLYIPDKEEMNDEEFEAFCIANSHLRIERDENKNIIIMPPVGGETGTNHTDIVSALYVWNSKAKLGKTFDSSTGFTLPDSSMRSPDASWIKNEQWNSLSSEEKKGFVPFAPDFVVEILSPSDRVIAAKKKMSKWIQNGTRLGWLIDVGNKVSFIYRGDGAIDEVKGFDKQLLGEDVLPGFLFDLSILLSQ